MPTHPHPDSFQILLIRLPSRQVRENRQAPPEGVGSGREFRFLPRAGARFPPKFTPSTRLSRPRQAAGRALPLPALPFGMHGHSKDQNRKARPLAERGKRPGPRHAKEGHK